MIFSGSNTHRNRALTDISHLAGMALSSSSSWKGQRQLSLSRIISSGLPYFVRLSGTTKTLSIFCRLPGPPTDYLKALEKPPNYLLRQLWTSEISRK